MAAAPDREVTLGQAVIDEGDGEEASQGCRSDSSAGSGSNELAQTESTSNSFSELVYESSNRYVTFVISLSSHLHVS